MVDSCPKIVQKRPAITGGPFYPKAKPAIQDQTLDQAVEDVFPAPDFLIQAIAVSGSSRLR